MTVGIYSELIPIYLKMQIVGTVTQLSLA
jgi:hypothetical protein